MSGDSSQSSVKLNRFSQLLQALSFLPLVLQLVWRSSRHWTLVWGGILLIQGLLPVGTVYLTRWLVNSLVKIAGAGFAWDTIQTLLIPVLGMAAVLLLGEVLQSLAEWIRTAQSELIQEHVTTLVHQQAATIDYACYESSEYNDQLERARQDTAGQTVGLLEQTGSLLQGAVTLLAMTTVLLTYGIWLPIILCLSAVPAFYVMLRLNLTQYRWTQRTTTDRRRLQYYDILLVHGEIAAELRLFDLSPFLQTTYRQIQRRLRLEKLRLIQQQAIGRLLAGLLALLLTGLAMSWMGYQLLLGVLKLGDIALFYQAFNQGQGVVKSLISSFSQIYRNGLFIKDLFSFLNLRPQLIDPPNPLPLPAEPQQGLQFRNVTFRYPGCEEPILEGFNLTVPAGKVVAIVGDNGAGKSTLVKLLCRLYDPDSGSVVLDGTDIRHFSLKAFHRFITILFQAPVPYFVSAAENIAMGDIARATTVDLLTHTQQIESAAKAAGIHEKIMRLPQGYKTLLGRWFPGGMDLSGGEWQRLALARAFFRDSPIMILDEPTSAMDPWAEFDWLERMEQLSQGKTTLIITHRFNLAMRADIIYVMQAGKVVESGNHQELVQLGGYYAQSWAEQMPTQTPTQTPTQMPNGNQAVPENLNFGTTAELAVRQLALPRSEMQ
jgi:ATP-binding cassette, subfamily B, bacterial